MLSFGLPCIALAAVFGSNRQKLAFEAMLYISGNDFAGESIGRKTGLRVGMNAEKAAVAGFAQERPVIIDGMSTEPRPE